MEPLRFPTDRQTPRHRVFKIIKERSFERKHITLASGKESHFYFNMKPTMFNSEAAALLPGLILDRLQGVEFEAIGGLELGAVPLISPVCMTAHNERGWNLPGFAVRQKVKDHGTKQRIETADDLNGKKVVILDDVTTTGQSAMQAVAAVTEAGAQVVMVLAVVDREEGAAEFYREKGIPFGALFTASEFLNATA